MIDTTSDFHLAIREAMGDLDSVPDNPRYTVPMDALLVASQHSAALLLLLEAGLNVSATGVLRMQYEALLRAVWAFFAAKPAEVAALAAPLTTGTVKAAKSLGMSADLLKAIEASSAPDDLKRSLREIRTSAWDMMNSYIHAGIHPLRRHEGSHPLELATALKVSNGMLFLAAGLMVALSGHPERQQDINLVSLKFGDVLPARHVPQQP